VEYMTYSDGHKPFQISTDDVIPAIQLLNEIQSGVNLLEYFVPVMTTSIKTFHLENQTYTYSVEYSNAELCTDVYPVSKYPELYS
jgi:hypothetical protein